MCPPHELCCRLAFQQQVKAVETVCRRHEVLCNLCLQGMLCRPYNYPTVGGIVGKVWGMCCRGLGGTFEAHWFIWPFKKGFKRTLIRKITIFEDFLSNFYPENRPKTVRKTAYKSPNNLPEAFPEKLEIANKPVSLMKSVGYIG